MLTNKANLPFALGSVVALAQPSFNEVGNLQNGEFHAVTATQRLMASGSTDNISRATSPP